MTRLAAGDRDAVDRHPARVFALATRAEPADMSRERHDRIAHRLEADGLGQLTPAEHQDVEAHWRSCAICTGDLCDINER
jgi:hypothetical protein